MQGSCEHPTALCQCVDWKEDRLDVQIAHFMEQFEFLGFELQYTTLEPEKGRKLCKIGRCCTCGGRLCLGTVLPPDACADDLLAEICRWMYQMWAGSHKPLSPGSASFREMFLSVFHEEDREFAGAWMSKPENQRLCRMYRHTEKEER